MAESAAGPRPHLGLPQDAPDEESEQSPQALDSSVTSEEEEEEEEEEGSQWAVGAACRAVWAGDGLLYPATVRALDAAAGTCLVEFDGYGNKEQQALADLLPPCAASDPGEEEGPRGEPRRPRPPPPWELPPGRRRKSSTGERAPCSPQPQPVPPPWSPALLCALREEEEEEEALAAMLMSWYMSGYHTGFYMGLRKGRAEAAALLPRRGCRQKKPSPRS
ncbi:survival motor neuron protein 1-like isoform X2 [Dromaius novaehollandiae]|uniref:survival motor neuron protein 1-like isoform X2 n=1 Tax=Dromaius novaehollandiae TaxID=8790 RepID=UPI0031200F78